MFTVFLWLVRLAVGWLFAGAVLRYRPVLGPEWTVTLWTALTLTNALGLWALSRFWATEAVTS